MNFLTRLLIVAVIVIISTFVFRTTFAEYKQPSFVLPGQSVDSHERACRAVTFDKNNFFPVIMDGVAFGGSAELH